MPTCLSAAALVFTPAALTAQAPPLSGELAVNTYTTGPQQRPAVASRGNGSFVVVWEDGYRLSHGEAGRDGSTSGIYGQRFSSLGAKTGSEILVNTFTTGAQTNPAVAMNAAGQTVVIWDSPQDNPGEIFGSGVFGQRLDAAGAKVGAEFQVNTYVTGRQGSAAVAMDAAGEFVVVWASTGQDGSMSGVYGQRFDAAGAKVGPEFRINSYTTGEQFAPSIAMDPAGDFVVVWQSDSQDGDGYGVFGQLFDASAGKKGSEFPVNSYTTGAQGSPSVAMDRVGDFVVAFASYGPDLDGYGIWAHRFNASAESLGLDFEVNSYTTGNQMAPSVAVDREGNFTVVWESQGQDGFKTGVYGQRFDRRGALIGSEFQVNAFTTNYQEGPRVFDDGSGFAAVWTSETQDGDGPGVFARRQNVHPRELSVDTQGIGITDQNGVFEPNESVVMAPAWSNDGSLFVALDATISNFEGPSGPIYTQLGSAADYGAIPPGALADCNTPCYALQISGARPRTHWDATVRENLSVGGSQTWSLHIGDSFTDVPRSQPFYKKIETLLHHGITSGCTTTQYCPGDAVARDQMAIFIAKGIAGLAENVPTTGILSGQPYDCTAGGASRFTDVAPTDDACRHVHYIAAKNVTLGCSPTQYCPTAGVTRDAMASFIAKAIVAPGGGNAVPLTYGPDPATNRSYSCAAGSPNTHFSDVPASNAFCKHIHYLWAKGIVDGCSATKYCPTAAVARDAMAKFLANGFELQLYQP